MAPKKEDKLAGRRVLAPASLWPDFPLPKGQKGWAGVVGKKKDARNHFVTFPDSGDTGKYFFADEDIKCWLVDDEVQAAAPAKAPAGGKGAAGSHKGAASGRTAAAEAPASSHKGAASGSTPAKRKVAEAAGASQPQLEEAARPSKKGKAAVVAAADTGPMPKESLKQLILSTIESLDKEQLRAVYSDILALKLGKR